MKIPKYCRHKATGQAYVTVNKRRHYLGVYGTSESEERYRRFVQMYTATPASPKVIQRTPGAEIEVIELCAAYLLHAEQYYQNSPQSLDRVKAALRILKLTHASTPVSEFGPLALQAIQLDLARKGMTRSYVNHLTGAIKRVFKWGVTQEIVPGPLFAAIKEVSGLQRGRSPAMEPEAVEPVEDSVIDETLPGLEPIVADMVRLQRLTGCRPGEVVLIRPCDIDRSGNVWEYRPEEHKTAYCGGTRIIFIGPRAQEILRPYLLRPADAYCFSPAECMRARLEELHANRKTPLSCGNRPGKNRVNHPRTKPGDRYTSGSYRQHVHRTIQQLNAKRLEEARKAGLAADHVKLIPHWSPNQLRHTAATEVRKAFGLEATQVVLGHSRADVTQVYAERDCELARKVAQRIG